MGFGVADEGGDVVVGEEGVGKDSGSREGEGVDALARIPNLLQVG